MRLGFSLDPRLGLDPGGPQTIVMLLLRFAVAIAASYLFYRLVEVRAIRASRRLRGPVDAASHPVVA